MSMVGYYSHNPSAAGRGIVHQAFADAVVQNELRDFYRLMAMLGALSRRPRSEDSAYLSVRRLRVWLLDPTRRMRILAHVAQQCEGKKVRRCRPPVSPRCSARQYQAPQTRTVIHCCRTEGLHQAVWVIGPKTAAGRTFLLAGGRLLCAAC